MPVQGLLKKASLLDIKMICPLHGPILKKDLEYYIEKYNIWSSYKPEDTGIVIAYASIHGNTADVAKEVAKILEEEYSEKVNLFDLARCDIAEVVEDAFRYDKMILAASSYDGEVFTPMDIFLRTLKHKNYQNRKIRNNRKWNLGTSCWKIHEGNIRTNEKYNNM